MSTVTVNIVVPDVTQIMKPVICFYIFVLYIDDILIVGVSYLNLVEEQNPTYGWLICTALLLQNKRTTFIQMSCVSSERNLKSLMWTCLCGDNPKRKYILRHLYYVCCWTLDWIPKTVQNNINFENIWRLCRDELAKHNDAS